MDFNSLNNIQIRNWLIQNKVCIVTNSRMVPGSMYLASLKTYIDYIPTFNYWCIPGETEAGRPFYGNAAFQKMVNLLISDRKYDYVIYIDEDCFIKDFKALMADFETFINGNYCIGGPQDGGVICHRNHSCLLINTFISYWNIKAIRDKYVAGGRLENYDMSRYSGFRMFLENNKVLADMMWSMAEAQIEKSHRYREDVQGTPPYTKVVENDPNNPVERHQKSYSYDDRTAEINFEPYYQLEERIIALTGLPVYYMNTVDLYNKEENTPIDNTGISSRVMTADNVPFAYHTWYSRAFNLYGKTDVEKKHTERIQSVIKNL